MDIDLIFCKTSFVIMLFFDCICLDAAVDTLGNILDIMIIFLLHSVNFYPSTSYVKPNAFVLLVLPTKFGKDFEIVRLVPNT